MFSFEFINKRNLFLCLGFIFLILISLFFIIQIEDKLIAKNIVNNSVNNQIHLFTNPYFYRVKSNRPEIYFKATKMKYDSRNAVIDLVSGFVWDRKNDNKKESQVIGEMISENLKDKWFFSGQQADIHFESWNLNLKGQGNIYNNQFQVHAEFIKYSKNQGQIEALGEVNTQFDDKENNQDIKITSDEMVTLINEKKSEFKGNVIALMQRKKRYEGEAQAKSDHLLYNELESLITLNRNVWIKRGNFTSTAERGEIFLENFNKKLKYYRLYDDIKLTQLIKSDDSSQKSTPLIRKAYANFLDGFVKEAKVVLTGAPRVLQGKDIIKGYQITLREEADLVEIDDSQTTFDVKRKKE
jgi:lipopolysaccharide export system protein LptA